MRNDNPHSVADDLVRQVLRSIPEQPLPDLIRRLRVQRKTGRLQVEYADGPGAFFFEEGTAARYANARYGEFRVSDDGDMILTGLRDAQRRPL